MLSPIIFYGVRIHSTGASAITIHFIAIQSTRWLPCRPTDSMVSMTDKELQGHHDILAYFSVQSFKLEGYRNSVIV